MPPTPSDVTLQEVLNKANLNQLATVLQKVKLGNVLSPVKVVVTGLSAASAIDITSAVFRLDVTASAEQIPRICTAIGLLLKIGDTRISLVLVIRPVLRESCSNRDRNRARPARSAACARPRLLLAPTHSPIKWPEEHRLTR